MDRIISLSRHRRAVLHRDGDRPVALTLTDFDRDVRIVLDAGELRNLRRALADLPEEDP
jgi:hypothetical protein